jgi:hypothetical protein
MNPTVSFIVPCYRLAHLLEECVTSILAQTFSDFEVLIMDDCSPDNTAAVAASFSDPRVKYVRNAQNLGNVRNYNEGIRLARGRYIWLISADDYLRRPYVLERYLKVMERDERIGYAICSAVGVTNGQETGLLEYSRWEPRDRVMSGHDWLRRLLRLNVVVAGSGLVRRECYDRVSLFPLDMPWACDWYLWCVFAFEYDVAYFEEPMVCYRQHELSMTNQLTRSKALACCEEEIFIQWEMRRKAAAAGCADLVRACQHAVAGSYAYCLVPNGGGLTTAIMTDGQFEESLARHAPEESEKRLIRALTFAAIGDDMYRKGDRTAAARYYQASLALKPLQLNVLTKRALLPLGAHGRDLRSSIRSLGWG